MTKRATVTLAQILRALRVVREAEPGIVVRVLPDGAVELRREPADRFGRAPVDSADEVVP